MVTGDEPPPSPSRTRRPPRLLLAPPALPNSRPRSRRGARAQIAVTAHPLATRAALAMLDKGGSPIDAAIAAQMVLGLVEPQSSGLGGGTLVMNWDAAVEEAHLLRRPRRRAFARATASLRTDTDGKLLDERTARSAAAAPSASRARSPSSPWCTRATASSPGASSSSPPSTRPSTVSRCRATCTGSCRCRMPRRTTRTCVPLYFAADGTPHPDRNDDPQSRLRADDAPHRDRRPGRLPRRRRREGDRGRGAARLPPDAHDGAGPARLPRRRSATRCARPSSSTGSARWRRLPSAASSCCRSCRWWNRAPAGASISTTPLSCTSTPRRASSRRPTAGSSWAIRASCGFPWPRWPTRPTPARAPRRSIPRAPRRT